ncbi:MAG: hypothetical protein IJJ93_03830 [Acidaminococcaceae bacterium]|nr:hypothetical protein [Acidaminococcaceae bacterium]
MRSPGHRANILNKDYKELGVGYCRKEGTEYTLRSIRITGFRCSGDNCGKPLSLRSLTVWQSYVTALPVWTYKLSLLYILRGSGTKLQ